MKRVLLLGMILLLALTACASPKRVYVVSSRPGKTSRLGHGFSIHKGPPPVGSDYLGEVRVRTEPQDFRDALDEIRREAYKLGGNSIAFFRCLSRHEKDPSDEKAAIAFFEEGTVGGSGGPGFEDEYYSIRGPYARQVLRQEGLDQKRISDGMSTLVEDDTQQDRGAMVVYCKGSIYRVP